MGLLRSPVQLSLRRERTGPFKLSNQAWPEGRWVGRRPSTSPDILLAPAFVELCVGHLQRPSVSFLQALSRWDLHRYQES